MKLAPKPGAPSERILCYGSHGTGKSSAYLSIAEKVPDATFHVLDSDESIARMLFERDLPNVQATPVESWQDYVEATRKVTSTMAPHDWLVIDMLGPAWQAAHAYYVETKFGKEVPDFYMDFAVAGKKGNPLQGDTDWAQINRVWRAYEAILKKCPGNLFATTGARATGERDSAEQTADYGHLGARPDGQKQLGHLFHTVLYLTRKARTGERLVTTAKDRGRRELVQQQFADLSTTYLMGVAGWRPA